MKFNAVAAIAMAAIVSAQSAADIPPCAIPCLDKSVKSQTSCGTTDFACICKKENFSKIQNDSSTCVIKECGAAKAVSEVLPKSEKLCEKAGAGKMDGGKGGNSGGYPPPGHTDKPTANPPDYKTTEEPAPSATTECPPTGAPHPEPSGNPNGNGTAQPSNPPVTAGAAGFAPVGGLAMLALGALAL